MNKSSTAAGLAAVPPASSAQVTGARGATGVRIGAAGQGVALRAFVAHREREVVTADADGDGRVGRAAHLAAARVAKQGMGKASDVS